MRYTGGMNGGPASTAPVQGVEWLTTQADHQT